MLLRSITKHVKDQNWFAVALDFFFVVAGILIAYQITHWNEARRDRALERDYLERIATELNKTFVSIEDSIVAAEEREQLVQSLNERLRIAHSKSFGLGLLLGRTDRFQLWKQKRSLGKYYY